ncbi:MULTISPECIES: DUF2505 domain-containing protein [Mycobacterium]|uniref:DUF2505 domain-containing protein n=1 Tax=Mycobacterium kiyosense TaxID=2871094 RepID=A0A9P3UXF0_9MYCO|nr:MULTISPECIES: DUF2505 domain-containing protein [Mycobacterium]BDB40363.1 hypothetical protein IWGMT90018_08090 [Mycobacterium kiyosense]BDE12183.1 hypothetical protein MKCMC460_10430 [Mycobacterium sp. 20KCMC460]GLB85926.1 hypothetical protein SRL2020028_51820 [Mycobacterium kiyosense]GLB88662.1 hypothetical protein SRL2020130_14790 [Mycobacterium kiyosense]GLB95068.1 hypothetical protein SRL2020226_18440 [Mycobacterium kiyosense]
MPRSFDMSAVYEGSVEDIHRAFHEEQYWVGRLAEVPTDLAAVEELRVGAEAGADAAVAVVTLQRVYRQNLPALVTQLHRGDLCIRREESWGPIHDGVATASIRGWLLDAPVSIWGTAVLSPHTESGGSRLTANMTVQVRVPLIGGKLEHLIGSQLPELINVEQRYTSQWMAKNA